MDETTRPPGLDRGPLESAPTDAASVADKPAETSGETRRIRGNKSRRIAADNSTEAKTSHIPFRLEAVKGPVKSIPISKNTDEKQDAATSAALLLNMANTMALAFVGPEGAMLPAERAFVEPALARTIARFPASTAAKFGGVLDPIIVLGVGVMWGSRVMRLREMKRATPPETAPTKQEQTQASGGLEPAIDATPIPQNGVPTAGGIPPQFHALGSDL